MLYRVFDTCSSKSFMRYSCTDFTRLSSYIFLHVARAITTKRLDSIPPLFTRFALLVLYRMRRESSLNCMKCETFLLPTEESDTSPNSSPHIWILIFYSSDASFSFFWLTLSISHSQQIHDTTACLESDCTRLAGGPHDRGHTIDMEQVGIRSRMWIRRNFLSMVHGGSYHTDIFACMARDAFCLLSNLARSFETSKAAEDTGTAGGIRLEVGASKQQNIKLDFFFLHFFDKVCKMKLCSFFRLHDLIACMKIAFSPAFSTWSTSGTSECTLEKSFKASKRRAAAVNDTCNEKSEEKCIHLESSDVYFWFILIPLELKWMSRRSVTCSKR